MGNTDSTKLAFVRIVCLCLPIVFLFSLFLFAGFAFAAECGNPGQDGVGTPSGVVNTYYPGTASVSAGATSIPVGSSSGSATPIAAGDLLLIIQMQDADISYSNNNNYGSNSGTGSGYTNLNRTGYYEYAVAVGAVSGGFVSITGGLTYSYRYRAASATSGQSTYQVIRLPQYSSATVSATLSALNWNGSVGGIVAIDVAGTLTISGTITADGVGFRGGFGRQLGGGAGANTDYRTSYLVNTNGSKGEGIVGSPYYMNRPATFNGAPAVATTSGSGYPDGATANASYARGAPGNAGGGGTDGNPSANDQNSGGGGGGNYAAGAKGGNSWNSNITVGGEGGSAVSGIAFNRVVMGGGGGAGTTNNGTADNTTYTNPAGLACTTGAGACSSGAPGGGIIILRANDITGGGTISANGGTGYNVTNDSGGGGGAGGSIVIYTYAGGAVNAYVNGGDGGNAWRSQDGTVYPGNRHGPGGGGSGGFIAYSPASLGISMSYTAGVSGKTTTAGDNYGSSSSSGGYATFDAPDPPGVLPGAFCVKPNLSTSTKTVSGGPYVSGDSVQYTITLTESNGIAASGVSVSDTIDTTHLTGLNITGCPSGATCSYSAPTLTATGINVPASGSVTIVYFATISATAGTNINNTATITNPNGPGATPAAPTITVVSVAGNKPLYLYDNASSPTRKLSRTPMTVNATSYVEIPEVTTYTWTLSPVLASAVTISSGNIPVRLWLTTINSRTYTIPVTLRCGATTVASNLTGSIALTAGNPPVAFNVTLSLASNYTCAAGNPFYLDVRNGQSGTGTRNIRVYPAPSTGNYSNVNLPSQNVIHVDSIGFYGATYPGGSALSSVPTGSTVYIRAQVSDPFGSYDIVNAPTITIKDPSNNTLVNAVAMTLVYTDPASPSLTKIYEYSYAVPSSPTGNWSVSVTATEGTEGTVTNTAYATMPVVVLLPNLFILKSADKSSASPGEVITYTIQVKNEGTGAASTVTLTDSLGNYNALAISPYSGSPFNFTEGSPASGLTLGTPTYSSDGGANYTYTPLVSGAGGAPAGYDGVVTDWKIIMNNNMNGNGGHFTINYNSIVK